MKGFGQPLFDPMSLFCMEIEPDPDGRLFVSLEASSELLEAVQSFVDKRLDESEESLSDEQVLSIVQDAVMSFVYCRGRVM